MSDEAASTLQAVSSPLPAPSLLSTTVVPYRSQPNARAYDCTLSKKKKKTSCPVFVFIAKTAVKQD